MLLIRGAFKFVFFVFFPNGERGRGGLFCVHSHAIEVGWSVQVHLDDGLLKTTSSVRIYVSSIHFKPDL